MLPNMIYLKDYYIYSQFYTIYYFVECNPATYYKIKNRAPNPHNYY